jgi:hypothetical protein
VIIDPQSSGGSEPLTTLRAYDRSDSHLDLSRATGGAGTIVLTPDHTQAVPMLSPTGLGVLGVALFIIAARGMRRSRG